MLPFHKGMHEFIFLGSSFFRCINVCCMLLFELFLMSMYWFGWKRSEQSLYKCGVWEYGKAILPQFLYKNFPILNSIPIVAELALASATKFIWVITLLQSYFIFSQYLKMSRLTVRFVLWKHAFLYHICSFYTYAPIG